MECGKLTAKLRDAVPVTGAITFKIMFEEGILPKVWPEARMRKTRKVRSEETPVPESITAGLQAALAQAEAEGQPVAEIAEAAAQGTEITAELNGQELTITAFVNAPAVYQNAQTVRF